MAWRERRLLEWIESRGFAASESVRVGPGDDAAVLARPGGEVAVTVDQVIEGVHYDPGAAAEDVARKLVGRNVSDLAAMGALPSHGVLASAASGSVAEEWIQAFLDAVARELGRLGASLIGGDLALAPTGFASALTLIGDSPARPARRCSGRGGDVLYVTGALGGSRAGRHLHPPSRVATGRWLVEVVGVECMMDLSDGLALDLERLCRASFLGARVETARLPVHPDAQDAARRSGRPVLEHVVGDGEDYELLFSLSPESDLPAPPPDGCPITRIGTLVAGPPRIAWLDARGEELESASFRGFEHGGGTP